MELVALRFKICQVISIKYHLIFFSSFKQQSSTTIASGFLIVFFLV